MELDYFLQHIGPFVMAHWQMSLLLVGILALLLLNEYLSNKKRAKELTTHSAIELINHENAVVFDIRDVEAFRTGHVIGALHATADDFNQKRMDKYKSKPIILVCAKGITSASLAAKLRKLGYEQPMVLAGGMSTWQADNLPLVKGKG